jgi:hypothetical protein
MATQRTERCDVDEVQDLTEIRVRALDDDEPIDVSILARATFTSIDPLGPDRGHGRERTSISWGTAATT